MPKALVAHACASIFPLMSGDEFDALKSDMAEHGQREPITLLDGRILDGRNRYRACQELKLDPKTRDLRNGQSPTAFVVSANLHRRHLSVGQKVAAGVEVEAMLAAEAKQRQKEHGGTAPGKGKNTFPKNGKSEPVHAEKQAAKVVGVSHSYIADAKKLKAEAPELLDAVKNDRMTLPKAKQELIRRKANEGLPSGKTPHQEAHEDPGRRWAASMHKLYMFMTSTRDLGGIKKLARKWPEKVKREYVVEVRRIIGELEKWASALEG